MIQCRGTIQINLVMKLFQVGFLVLGLCSENTRAHGGVLARSICDCCIILIGFITKCLSQF